MPVLIGAKPQSNFTDPIGLLTDCHRRIERFLSVLMQVAARAGGRRLTSDQRTALQTALRYFRESAPKHTADEEETLFPRLRRLDRPEVKAKLALVESLRHDHVRAEENHAAVDRLGQAWLDEGSLSAPDAIRLSALLTELAGLFRGHIAAEEGEVFPLAVGALTPRDRQAMGEEMAARRGLSGRSA